MKQKIEKNYYELLDVTPSSAADDIEEGYRQAMRLYGGDSDAVYSLYSKEEKESMLEMIKGAYETLTDPVKKREYDSMMLSKKLDEDPPEVDIDDLREAGGGLFKPFTVERACGSVRLKKKLFIESADPIVAEQYRILFLRLEETGLKNRYKVFSFTSSVKREGKSETCFNLAYIMANEFKKKTILVECDLRKPSTVVNNIENPERFGLADVLKGEKDLNSAISRVEGTGFYILQAGNLTKNVPELLNSPSFKRVMGTLKSEFDFVIVDSPPLLPLMDMNIISKIVDGVVIVVRAGKTHRDFVQKALKFVSVANVVGVILNGADTKLKKYYY